MERNRIGMPIRPPGYDKEGYSKYHYNSFPNPDVRVEGALNFSRQLRLGSVDDLEIDFFDGVKEYIRTSYGEREIPTYIVDDHNHALFGWCEALREKRISKNAYLIHFDQHRDGRSPWLYTPLRKFSLTRQQEACLAQGTEINRFIAPAIWMGIISDMLYWIDPMVEGMKFKIAKKTIRGRLREYTFSHARMGADFFSKMVWDEPDPKKIIVDIDMDYFSTIRDQKRIHQNLETMRYAMERAGVITIATSSYFYIDQKRAIQLIKELFTVK